MSGDQLKDVVHRQHIIIKVCMMYGYYRVREHA